MSVEVPEEMVVVRRRSGVSLPFLDIEREQALVDMLRRLVSYVLEVVLEVADEVFVEVFAEKMRCDESASDTLCRRAETTRT